MEILPHLQNHEVDTFPTMCVYVYNVTFTWIEQGLMSQWTHYRSYWGRVFRVKWPNQQCQSTKGTTGSKD